VTAGKRHDIPVPAIAFPAWRGFFVLQDARIRIGDRRREAYNRKTERAMREHIYFHATGGFP
jgi:hypothetical protein